MVLTTYTIIGREVGVDEDAKKDKQKQEMPATDQVSIVVLHFEIISSAEKNVV